MINKILKKAEVAVYKLLKEDGHQTKLNDIVEYVICAVIILNVILIVFESVELDQKYSGIINILRNSFFIFFLVEYILRVWIADLSRHDQKHPIKARIKYIFSFLAIIDLLALLPEILGATIIDFRIFRVLRLLRITQLKGINQYTNVLTRVFKLKGSQLLSSLFILLVFILVASVAIYDFENVAQPDAFPDVLSGVWWSISTITTIGYGDIYPVTSLGKIVGSFTSIIGVLLMAIPIGILTTGFFEISKEENKKKKVIKNDDAISKT